MIKFPIDSRLWGWLLQVPHTTSGCRWSGGISWLWEESEPCPLTVAFSECLMVEELQSYLPGSSFLPFPWEIIMKMFLFITVLGCDQFDPNLEITASVKLCNEYLHAWPGVFLRRIPSVASMTNWTVHISCFVCCAPLEVFSDYCWAGPCAGDRTHISYMGSRHSAHWALSIPKSRAKRCQIVLGDIPETHYNLFTKSVLHLDCVLGHSACISVHSVLPTCFHLYFFMCLLLFIH